MKKMLEIMKEKWFQFIVILLLSCLIVFGFDISFNQSEIKEVSYLTFEEMVEKEKVYKVYIDFSESEFRFVGTDNVQYKTDNPRTEGFKVFLLKNNIEVLEKSGNNQFFSSILSTVISLILWIVVFSFLFKGTLKTMTPLQNESSKKVTTSTVKFSDIASNNESKRDMMNLVNFLKNPNKYEEAGATMPKGVIFYGHPGTGKTLMAKAIAGEAGVPFFSTSGSDFVEMYVGVGAKRIRELFKEAKKNAPCLIFIDEIDAVGGKRGQSNSNSEREQTINALLNEMDGFSGSEGILVIAATNRKDSLDSALIRPGRFDRHIPIELPDLNGRLEILRLHAKNKKIGSDVNLEDLAKTTIGFSGSDLKTLLNEATIFSVDNDRGYITEEDIDKAFYQIVMSGQQKEDRKDRKKEEIQLIAWHEAGHAVAVKLLTTKSVPKVTIIPSTSGAGGVTFITPEKMGLHSKKDLINDIKIDYAGRIAEYLLLGSDENITTGASSDIKNATEKIRGMIEIYGMTDTFGLINLKDFEYIDNKDIVKEAQAISKSIYEEALSFLTDHKDIIESVANALMEKETLSESQLDDIIKKHQAKNEFVIEASTVE